MIKEVPTDTYGTGDTERTAVLLMVCTAVSRVLGFVRQVMIAAIFGASGQADVFHAMFNVPNNLRRLMAEGAFSVALVPALSRERDPTAQVEITRSALALQLAVMVPLIGIGLFAANPISRALVAFPDSEKMASAVGLFRVMVPYAALAGGGAVLMGALHARNVFVVPALAPLLFSVAVIGFVLAFAPSWGIYAAAVGVIAGGVMQLLFQVPSFMRRGFSMVPRIRFDHRMRRIIRGWGPAVASALVFSVMQQLSFLFASGLGDGSTSALGNAIVIFQLPLGVLSLSVVTASFPKLSRMAATLPGDKLRRTATDGMVTLAALLVPAGLIYLLLGEAVVHAILQRGRFEADATYLTTSVLHGFAIGLPSVAIFTYLHRICYAMDDPGRALQATIVVGVIDVVLSLWWKETALGVAGLSLANSVAFTAGVLVLALPSRLVVWTAWWKGVFQVTAGVVPAAALMWIVSARLPAPSDGPAELRYITLLGGGIVVAIMMVIATYKLVGLPFARYLAMPRKRD